MKLEETALDLNLKFEPTSYWQPPKESLRSLGSFKLELAGES